MKHYLTLYWRLVTLNVKHTLTYRGDFFSSVFSSMMWGIFSVLSVVLLSSKVPAVAGWDRGSMLLLATSYGIIVGIFHVIGTRNFRTMSMIIHKGELDGYLLKPVDSLWLLTSSSINLGNAVRFVASILFSAWLIHHFQMSVTILSVLGFILTTIVSVILLYSMFSLAGTLLIWYTNLSNIIEFVATTVGTARYPSDVLKSTSLPLRFFFLPFLLIVNIPVKILLGRTGWGEVALFVIATLILFVLSRLFWKFALRFYTSASG